MYLLFLFFSAGSVDSVERKPARWAENKRGRKQKKRNTCHNCVSVSHSRRMWDGAKSDVPLWVENEKMAGKYVGF